MEAGDEEAKKKLCESNGSGFFPFEGVAPEAPVRNNTIKIIGVYVPAIKR